MENRNSMIERLDAIITRAGADARAAAWEAGERDECRLDDAQERAMDVAWAAAIEELEAAGHRPLHPGSTWEANLACEVEREPNEPAIRRAELAAFWVENARQNDVRRARLWLASEAYEQAARLRDLVRVTSCC